MKGRRQRAAAKEVTFGEQRVEDNVTYKGSKMNPHTQPHLINGEVENHELFDLYRISMKHIESN